MRRSDFEAANQHLGATLRRLAPQLSWHGSVNRHRLTDIYGALIFEGSQYRWIGYKPGTWLITTKHAVSFYTYSWSWDGCIDEAYLADKIANAKYGAYKLSDNLPPNHRARETEPWKRIEGEEHRLRDRSVLWRFLEDTFGSVIGALIGALVVCAMAWVLLGLPVILVSWLIRLFR